MCRDTPQGCYTLFYSLAHTQQHNKHTLTTGRVVQCGCLASLYVFFFFFKSHMFTCDAGEDVGAGSRGRVRGSHTKLTAAATRCRRECHATAGWSESLQKGDRSRCELLRRALRSPLARPSLAPHSHCSLRPLMIVLQHCDGAKASTHSRPCPALLCSALPAALRAFPPACCCDSSLSLCVFVSAAVPRLELSLFYLFLMPSFSLQPAVA